MNELFQRPANYWLRHADRHKQSGDLIRAAVLQRHAMRAEPGSDAARMQYALTLHQLHCYEASSREAFCALAANPALTELYGLIGCSLLSMGLRREGLDALGIYMRTSSAMAPWHDEACDLADAYDYPFEEKKRQMRLNGLLTMAAHRIARGDLDGAAKALSRAQKWHAPNSRRELVSAAYWLQKSNPEQCALHLQSALETDFFDISTLVSAASMCHQLGSRPAARVILLRAASLAKTPSDEYLVCHTAESMNMLFVAKAMLERALFRQPDRCPLLYHLCVCALKMGNLQEAARYIHLCREIDPEDIPSETLFAQVMVWQQQGLSPRDLRRAARKISFYGSITPHELDACARPFRDALADGPQALADAIATDGRLRSRLLFLVTLPLDWPVTILQLACVHLPPHQAEALLREVLMQHPADSPAKRYAMNALRRMGAPAPYACWTADRFLLVDPERLYAPVPTFRQRFLTRFIHRLSRFCGQDVIPWALETISAMTPAKQLKLIGDPWKVWPLAFAMRWNALCGLPPVHIPFETLSTLRLTALKDALSTLHSIT